MCFNNFRNKSFIWSYASSKYFPGFEALAALTMKISLFMNIGLSCSSYKLLPFYEKLHGITFSKTVILEKLPVKSRDKHIIPVLFKSITVLG